MYIGVGVGGIFLVMMAGAHHIIVAIVALGCLYLGYQASKSGNSEYMLYSLLAAGLIFVILVLHGKEEPETGGMESYGAGGGFGLPLGY